MAPRTAATCRKSLQQHFPNLDREIQRFREMLEDLTKGEGKWMLPLSQLSKKMHKRCQTIGNVIFDMENAQHAEEDKTVATELIIEVEKYEEQIKHFLEVIGKTISNSISVLLKGKP